MARYEVKAEMRGRGRATARLAIESDLSHDLGQ